MNEVVRILMRRNGMTEKEATAQVRLARQMMVDCCFDYDECENIMMYELGLEMDYIYDIL